MSFFSGSSFIFPQRSPQIHILAWKIKDTFIYHKITTCISKQVIFDSRITCDEYLLRFHPLTNLITSFPLFFHHQKIIEVRGDARGTTVTLVQPHGWRALSGVFTLNRQQQKWEGWLCLRKGVNCGPIQRYCLYAGTVNISSA